MPSQSAPSPVDHPLLIPEDQQELISTRERKWVSLAVSFSLLGNLILFAGKLYAFIVSMSQAVLASLVDSAVDIISQLVVYICDREMGKVDKRYPIGKTKLQTVAAIVIACVMTSGALAVVYSCCKSIVQGLYQDDPPMPDMSPMMYGILGGAVVLKLGLFFVCYFLRKLSDSTLVLAEDHRNDVLSNTVAIATAAIATHVQPNRWWWVDPAGGIIISAYIIYSWLILAKSQVNKIIGLEAPSEVFVSVQELTDNHDERLEVDAIRAYHFGIKYFVEIDVVVPGNTTVAESHDIAVDLQRKVEVLSFVERAFVHVDYVRRDTSEHKVDWSHPRGN